MKNKSLSLLVIMSALLLSGCGKTEEKHEYHYESDEKTIAFDYSFNESFKTKLDQIYLVDQHEISDVAFSQFLTILSLNDNYANHVVITTNDQLLYLENDDTTKVAGDYIKETVKSITRNNSTNSLSGTVEIHDESWTENEETHVLEHNNVDTSGTYSLSHEENASIGYETITCDNEAYSSTVKIGYSEQNWGEHMNLTQSEDFGLLLTEKMNEVKTSGGYTTSLVSSKSEGAIEIAYNAVKNLKTTDDSIHQNTYSITIKIAGGMIVETEYKYYELEKTDTQDFVVELHRELREISHQQ